MTGEKRGERKGVQGLKGGWGERGEKLTNTSRLFQKGGGKGKKKKRSQIFRFFSPFYD